MQIMTTVIIVLVYLLLVFVIRYGITLEEQKGKPIADTGDKTGIVADFYNNKENADNSEE